MKKLILSSKGNGLTYALGALHSYMEVANDYNFLNESLMEKIVSSIFDSNVNSAKQALSIVNLFTRPNSPSHGAQIFMSRKKETLPYGELIEMLDRTDVALKTETLCFLTNLLAQSEESTLDIELEKLGINEILLVFINLSIYLEKNLEIEELRPEISRYQVSHFRRD